MNEELLRALIMQLTARSAMQQNQQYAKPGPYGTMLMPSEEFGFRNWLQANAVPFNTSAGIGQDYDMRGFYKALQQRDPIAISKINPKDLEMHYPDFWKTPYHQSFSSGSQWAKPWAPSWNRQDQLVDTSGNIVFDENRR